MLSYKLKHIDPAKIKYRISLPSSVYVYMQPSNSVTDSVWHSG